jgi:AcrR family transcriptional regulator
MPDTQPTTASIERLNRRELLMRTAEQLFASKGIDAVSLNEINKAAGQRNTSALHYHFGSKKALVDTIIYHHYDAIGEQINRRLDLFEQLSDEQQTPRRLLQAMITPFADQLDSERGNYYLSIVSQVFMRSTDMILNGHPGIEDTARRRIYRLVQQTMMPLPAELGAARQVLYASLTFHSLANFSKVNEQKSEAVLGGKTLFVNNLLDSLEAVINNPPSTETQQIIDTLNDQ